MKKKPGIHKQGLMINEQLQERGVDSQTVLMPHPREPVYADFKKEFKKYEVNEDTILIGHSCGGAFLVRWLGENPKKISKLILVAPWKIPDKADVSRRAFYDYEIDETIKSKVKEVVIFTSNDEDEDGKESVKIFYNALGGKIINLSNHGHYLFRDMGTEQFPELLQVILN